MTMDLEGNLHLGFADMEYLYPTSQPIDKTVSEIIAKAAADNHRASQNGDKLYNDLQKAQS